MSAELEHFVGTAQHGSIKAYVAESGYHYRHVAKYIRKLEEWAGFWLFVRGGEITPEAKAFLPYAERALAADRQRDYKRAIEIEEEGKQAVLAGAGRHNVR